MSMIFDRKVVCACCGKTTSVRVVGSTNAFGYCDLDFRPPEMKRSTMALWTQECPACGYVANDISKAEPQAKEIMSSKEYISCDGVELQSPLAKRFVRLAIMIRKLRDGGESALRSEAQAFLCAAWDCDDHHDHTAAIELRKKAALLLEQCEIEGSAEMLLQLCDLYRRSIQFDKAAERFSSVTLQKPVLQQALIAELELAAAEDSDRYRFAPEGKVERDTVFFAFFEETDGELRLIHPGGIATLDAFDE